MSVAIESESDVDLNLVEGADVAFRTYLPSIVEVCDRAVGHMHIGVDRAIRLGLVASCQLRGHAAQLAMLPGSSPSDIDDLNGVARALYHANRERRRSKHQRANVLQPGRAMRTKMVGLAKLFVTNGWLPAASVAALHGGNGRVAVSNDLTDLAVVFDAHRDRIDAGSLLSDTDIDAMRSLASQLYADSFGDRPAHNALSWDQIVARGFARLRLIYDKLRRGMKFLLGKAADAVIPPFVNKRKRSTAAARNKAVAGVVDAAPEADVTTESSAEVSATEVVAAAPVDHTPVVDSTVESILIAGETPGPADAVARAATPAALMPPPAPDATPRRVGGRPADRRPVRRSCRTRWIRTLPSR